MIRVLLVALLGLPAVSYGLNDERFAEANALYEARQFDSAAAVYQAILSEGTESSHLYYNLANAQFKAGRLGQSIANYLRAQRLDPTDDDLQANLAIAKSFAPVQVEGASLHPISDLLKSLFGPIPLHRLGWSSSVLFLTLIVLLVLRFVIARTDRWIRPAALTVAVLFTLAAGATTWKYRTEFVQPRGVVVASEAPVYTGPTTQSEVELQAAPGMVVEILDQSGEFVSVRFENMRRGWIRLSLLETI